MWFPAESVRCDSFAGRSGELTRQRLSFGSHLARVLAGSPLKGRLEKLKRAQPALENA